MIQITAMWPWAGLVIYQDLILSRGKWARDDFLLPSVQTWPGAHPASRSVGTKGCFHGVQQLGYGVEHSPFSDASVRNVCVEVCLLCVIRAWCFIKYRNEFTFTNLDQ
jgi:hypothetical protein